MWLVLASSSLVSDLPSEARNGENCKRSGLNIDVMEEELRADAGADQEDRNRKVYRVAAWQTSPPWLEASALPKLTCTCSGQGIDLRSVRQSP